MISIIFSTAGRNFEALIPDNDAKLGKIRFRTGLLKAFEVVRRWGTRSRNHLPTGMKPGLPVFTT